MSLKIEKEGYPLKSGYFTAIGLRSVKTLADRCRHAVQLIITSTSDTPFNNVNINDLE